MVRMVRIESARRHAYRTYHRPPLPPRAGDLVLEAEGVYDALVGQPAANPVARAGGVLRVAPGAPATSYLMRKILGDLGSGEGVRMPLGNPPLPEHEVARIRAWILAGAPAQ